MRIFEFKTINTTLLRTLFESLKEMLTEVLIEINHEGIKIRNLDSSETLIVLLNLEAQNFEEFQCEREMTIGLNIMNFYKIIKTCSASTILHVFYDSETEGILNIVMEDEEKKSLTKYKSNLIETKKQPVVINIDNFKSMSLLPCVDFQKIVKDIKQFSDKIGIKTHNDTLTFNCRGDFTVYETVIESGTEDVNLIISKETTEPIEGSYNLKSIMNIIKCTNLCQKVKFYFLSKCLVLEYQVGSLGDVKFIIAKTRSEEEEY